MINNNTQPDNWRKKIVTQSFSRFPEKKQNHERDIWMDGVHYGAIEKQVEYAAKLHEAQQGNDKLKVDLQTAVDAYEVHKKAVVHYKNAKQVLQQENEKLKAELTTAQKAAVNNSNRFENYRDGSIKERDALKERCDKMEAVLKELVRLKDKKDKEGSFIGYQRLKQFAWEAAREALKEGESNAPAPVRQKDIYIFHNNSDAFRQWVTEIKGYVILLLSHSTGVVLPMGITREMFEMEWKEYEKANNPKYKQ